MKVQLYAVLVQVVCVACNDKRVLLHSVDDVAAQLDGMQARISQLETRLGHVETENQQLRTGKGSAVYIRWGKTSCPGNGTDIVYKGYAAGNHNGDYGGGVDTLCLPDDPTWSKYNDAAETWTGQLHALEIDASDTLALLGTNFHDQDVPCVMCKTTRSVSTMIPGRSNCYPGWTLEYGGYLMSGQHSLRSNTDYICLDAHPEAVAHGGTNDDDHVMYFTESRCDSLSCPPYVNGRELACVVCSQ